jgi:hypothetical protein
MPPTRQCGRQDKRWNDCVAWHALFDAVCIDRGHSDTKSLADLFCAATGRQSRHDFETTCKNIGNWRRGRRRPRPPHFGVLTEILKVDADPELHTLWNALYRGAQRPAEPETENADLPVQANEQDPLPANRSRVRFAWAAAVTIAVTSAILAVALTRDPVPPGAVTSIAHLPSVHLRVGETAVLHAARSRQCGAEPQPWMIVKHQLPVLAIGEWHDGGIVMRKSMVCGTPVPARALRFKATSPGDADIVLEGDKIAIKISG